MALTTFIVRPFGQKKGIDFDRVDAEIIQPALKKRGLTGSTTGAIAEQGNIRIDMFQKLLTADLVIADVSIHNANVFYELGIRHALRGKRTILIKISNDQKKPIEGDEIPFDLKTDRYMSYNIHDAKASYKQLAKVIKETIHSQQIDSPVFQLLPKLNSADPDDFLVLPKDFQEEVDLALKQRDRAKLQLLFTEVPEFEWGKKGLRHIGRAQNSLSDWEAAKRTWQLVRKHDDCDIEANTLLSTIYQRLGDLASSDQAIQRVLATDELDDTKRAEIYALKARNMKTRWEEEWTHIEDMEERQKTALDSTHLKEARRLYTRGYQADRNHFYSGLNAVAMTTILLNLADKHPEAWLYSFQDDDDAIQKRRSLKRLQKDLISSVRLAIESHKHKSDGDIDVWTKISAIDLEFLSSKRPPRIQTGYKNILKDASDQAIDSICKQLSLYKKLGILEENTQAAFNAVEHYNNETSKDIVSTEDSPPHIIIFKGHRIDDENRAEPRFPHHKAEKARKKILEALQLEQANTHRKLVAFAGGGSGGDILFHEACTELGIPSIIHLPLSIDEYIQKSIRPAQADWVERFKRLTEEKETVLLSEHEIKLPKWLKKKPDYSIWQRSNIWVLYQALVKSENNITLMALWDGIDNDLPGGTDDMVSRANEHGAIFRHLSTEDL